MKKKKQLLTRLALAFSLFATVGASAQTVDISLAQDGSNILVNLESQGVSYDTEIWNSLTFTVKYPTASGVTLDTEFQADNFSAFGGVITGNTYGETGFFPELQSSTTDGGYTYNNYTFVSTLSLIHI